MWKLHFVKIKTYFQRNAVSLPGTRCIHCLSRDTSDWQMDQHPDCSSSYDKLKKWRWINVLYSWNSLARALKISNYNLVGFFHNARTFLNLTIRFTESQLRSYNKKPRTKWIMHSSCFKQRNTRQTATSFKYKFKQTATGFKFMYI